MPTYKTKGIIIKRTDLGEADKILSIFTPNLGKVSAVARGVRKITSKLGGHLELFCSVDLILAQGKNLDVVTSAQKNYYFKNLCFNLKRTSHAYYICELVDKFTPDNFKDTRLYNLLFFALDNINREVFLDGKMGLILNGFKIKLLGILGYGPEFKKCLKCNKNGVGKFFSFSLGGVLCEDCLKYDKQSIKVSFESLKALSFLEKNNFERIGRLDIDRKLMEEVEKILDLLVRYILDKECKSKVLLYNVGNLERIAAEIRRSRL